MKNIVKAVLLAGMSGMFSSFSILASPIDASVSGASALVHLRGGGSDVFDQDFQHKDIVTSESGLTSIDLAEANPIPVMWNASPGHMHVVNPTPAVSQNNGLKFSLWLSIERFVSAVATPLTLAVMSFLGLLLCGHKFGVKEV